MTLHKFFVRSLFLLLLVYLSVRAWVNDPLHDEVATFYNFIEPGKILGPGIIQDAQNHLLNTYLSYGMFCLFGDDFFWLRFPNLLGFILYFFGTVKLSEEFKCQKRQLLFILMLNTVPFMMEYFAYSRGYGLGISFFIWMIYALILWSRSPSVKNAFLTFFFAYFSVFSNLIFFPSALISAAILLMTHFRLRNVFSTRENKALVIGYLIYGVTLVPFLWFARMLKLGGALYYGSLEGFWQVTGKSLSGLVLFYQEDWLRHAYTLLFMTFIIALLISFRKNGFWNQLFKRETTLSILLFGNIIAILILAHVFKVNYPEDRVGMYLIPLFIILTAFWLERWDNLKFSFAIFFFFPVSFLYHLSFETSVFSPDDRMSDHFYSALRGKIPRDKTLVVDPMMTLTWSFHQRSEKYKCSPNARRDNLSLFDYVLAKRQIARENNLEKEYELIAEDPWNSYVAYKRITSPSKIFLFQLKNRKIESSAENIVLLNIDKDSIPSKRHYQLDVKGTLRLYGNAKNLGNLKMMIENFEPHAFSPFPFRWSYGPNTNLINVDLHQLLPDFFQKNKRLYLIISNPDRLKISLHDVKISLYEVCPD
jgi:hypothetical protein